MEDYHASRVVRRYRYMFAKQTPEPPGGHCGSSSTATATTTATATAVELASAVGAGGVYRCPSQKGEGEREEGGTPLGKEEGSGGLTRTHSGVGAVRVCIDEEFAARAGTLGGAGSEPGRRATAAAVTTAEHGHDVTLEGSPAVAVAVAVEGAASPPGGVSRTGAWHRGGVGSGGEPDGGPMAAAAAEVSAAIAGQPITAVAVEAAAAGLLFEATTEAVANTTHGSYVPATDTLARADNVAAATAAVAAATAAAAEAEAVSATAAVGSAAAIRGDVVLAATSLDGGPPDDGSKTSVNFASRKALNRQLGDAVTWREVRELLALHGTVLDEVHLLVAARRLRAVAPQPGRRVAREQARFRVFMTGFTELCGHYLSSMGPVPLAGVLYSLAVLRCTPPAAWMTSWLAVSEHRLLLQEFGPQELANSVYALAQLEYDPGGMWMGRLQGLSQIIWGLARLGYQPQAPFMRAFCTEVLRQLPYFMASGLSNTLWGLTVLSYRPSSSWVATVGAACLRLMPAFSSYDLSISSWALLRLGFAPDRDWLAGFLSASYSQLPSAAPEHAARMLWCLASLGLMPPADWLRHWLSLTYVRLLEAESTSLTTMMWGLATLGIRPNRRWVDLLLVAAWEQPLRSFSPPDLVMLLWGLSKCGAVPEEAWMEEFCCISLGQAPSARWLSGHEVVTLARMDEQTAAGLSQLSYSYGMLERTPCQEWFSALYGAAAKSNFDDFDAMSLERLIWGIAKMDPPTGSRPECLSPGWTEAFLAGCAVRMYDMSYCNLANVLFALALLGLRPGAAWLMAAVARGEELLGEFGQQTAAKALWALPRLLGPYDSVGAAAAAAANAAGGVGEGSSNCHGADQEEAQRAVLRLYGMLEQRIVRMMPRRSQTARV
ncbi:hypothetical protein VOLCADRAFT_116232 [Volvox carteri f. nagariensis]|uniref:Tbc2 translation factor, chloroplastic n=1 Tax=Volvox carteri f. nagariensis TaxID=3068 RepID=D8TKA4_VOLCA|nr:uncharacterized protein VOLCADRAFT_116232 [Volvox carteri f. nagariensis]EFJ52024.1 hypothetical protein VOLCADRAFT_116232 [Volvox carteri f. nagariensis]|eukprot:XP_002946798.1 hypothetical protein VOLCADRAFT_116232 [Volvox carteri f. nagariensis]